MKAMKKKLNNASGFTLIEMLIVVAIIAILIAISIPLVSSALEKSRDATDQANERSAKAEATIIVLTGEEDDQTGVTNEYEALINGDAVPYDAVNGQLDLSFSGPGYGKCQDLNCDANDFLSGDVDHEDKYITVEYDKAGDKFTIAWTDGT